MAKLGRLPLALALALALASFLLQPAAASDDRLVLQEEKRIGNRIPSAFFDQPELKLAGVLVLDEARN